MYVTELSGKAFSEVRAKTGNLHKIMHWKFNVLKFDI